MKNTTTLYCFTPLVTLATCIIEIALALYSLYRYRKTLFGKVSIILLFALASFQLAEWMVCKGGGSMDFWMRLGFIGTVIMPALGMHLIHIVNDKKYKWLTVFSYIVAALVSLLIFFYNGHEFDYLCTGKFVTFQLGTAISFVYFLEYTLFTSLSLLILIVNILRKGERAHRRLNLMMLLAFSVFSVPSFVMHIVTKTIGGGSLPSITCGFAIVTAIILVAKILPEYHRERK